MKRDILYFFTAIAALIGVIVLMIVLTGSSHPCTAVLYKNC